MIYPKFINKKSVVGVTAPSDGIIGNNDIYRLENAKKKLNDEGYSVIETSNVRKSSIGRSGAAKERAEKLLELYKNKDVDWIICAAGGDFLVEILPYIDFDIIKNNVKWIQGYSDPTSILYSITTLLDIATVYANNVKTFGMSVWHKSLFDNLKILSGKSFLQQNYDKYEGQPRESIIGDEEYNLTDEVEWKTFSKDNSFKVRGRIIGGCLDNLDTIIGTKYDGARNFITKYKDDGIIWYFDNCELTSEQVIRALFKFKVMGYFKYTSLVIFGRNMTDKSCYNVSFKDAIFTALSDLNIKIIYDADIGHVAPQMTIINGAIACVCYNNGKGSIEFELI